MTDNDSQRDRARRRKKIAFKNPLGKTARAFVVQIAAIATSILLAFSINAWWDERKDRAEERQALESLHVEFEINRDEAAAVVSAHEIAVQSVAALNAMSDEQVLQLSPEAVARNIRFFANPRTFDAVRGTLDALISSGKLGLLQDPALRGALTTFLNVLEDTVEDRHYMAQSSMTVWTEIARNGGPYRRRLHKLTADECGVSLSESACYINALVGYLPTATPADLIRLRDNAILMGYVNRNKVNSARYAGEIRQVSLQIDAVLALLEEHR